ncbi:MAG: transcriptional regulator [Phycisphaeraceae bacterium]|nr:MAG: transcriptional regulator [Phycisphaeraceae bacterium]
MCTACLSKPVPTDEFAQQLLGLVNGAAIVQMISIGHRTGLFDAMSGLPASTSEQIAAAGGLDERYVREWLGTMTTGGIVSYDRDAKKYELPESHAALLTRAAGSNNLAATTQFVPVLAGVEDEIVECFREGGGVPYSSYPRFHEVMAEESDMTVVAGLREHILPLVPGLIDRLAKGIDVLDVGCGRGHGIIELAAAFGNSRFVGLDLSPEAVAYANDRASARGLTNVRFDQRDLSGFTSRETFDLITAFDSVHDQADPAGMLAGIAGALRPGGVFLMQDIAGSSEVGDNIGKPLAPFIYTISCMHCMSVSLAQGGAGLGAAWGEELAQEMLGEAGFSDVCVNRLDHDIMNAFYVARR